MNYDTHPVIGYLTEYDPHDITRWSGLGYNIWNALSAAGASIEFVNNINNNDSFLKRIFIKLLYANNSNSRWFMVNQSVDKALAYGSIIGARLSNLNVDCVFSPSSFPIAYVETDRPKVFYTDATFQCMLNYYPSFSNLTPKCIARGHQIEQQAIDSSSLIIYSSEWAAESAIKFYGASPGKIRVVPFGASLSKFKSLDQFLSVLNNKGNDSINILFVGVDWERKGGNLVIDTCKALVKRGINLKLNIVGVDSIPYKKIPSFVRIWGLLNMGFQENRKVMEELFETAHFLFVPSKSDCSPVVFAEAAAFGLPSISRETGGIPSVVKNAYNGILLKSYDGVTEYVEVIMNLINDTKRYKEISLNAFEAYREKFNWNRAGKHLLHFINESIHESKCKA